MRTEIDLDAAAEEGIINEHQAIALRNFQAEMDGLPIASAEKFRLFGGYADLVGALGLGLVLFAAFMLMIEADLPILIPVFAAVSFFIARRIDMRASPAVSTICMIAFLFSGTMIAPALLDEFGIMSASDRAVMGVVFSLGCIVTTAIFWRRFHFPPTLATAVTGASLVLIDIATRIGWRDFDGYLDFDNLLPAAVALIIALGALAAAIWYDLTDIRRETERSQTAFWLHCCAGFLLTRALFSLLTGVEVIDGNLMLTGIDMQQLPWLLAMVLGAALLSLLLDRRSLLTGVLLPLVGIFGNGDWEAGMGMLLAGSGLLFFNYGWVRMRIALLALLPTMLAAQLPRTSLTLHGQRPTRRHAEFLPLRPGRSL